MRNDNGNGLSPVSLFFRIIHWLALGFLCWSYVAYVFNPDALISFYRFLSLGDSRVMDFIPYIRWFAEASRTPDLTRALMSATYLCFIVLFINLYVATYPQFSGFVTRKYSMSLKGLELLFEENVYGRLRPALSPLALSRVLWGEFAQGRQSSDGKEHGPLTRIFLRTYGSAYYVGMAMVGFVLFPWFAFTELNETGLSATPFSVLFVISAYIQGRCVFELLVLAISGINFNHERI